MPLSVLLCSAVVPTSAVVTVSEAVSVSAAKAESVKTLINITAEIITDNIREIFIIMPF